jgi:hypothetical protein
MTETAAAFPSTHPPQPLHRKDPTVTARLQNARRHLAAFREALQQVLGRAFAAGERRLLFKARVKARRMLPELVAELLQHPELLPLGHSASELASRWRLELEMGSLLDQARQAVSLLADAERRTDGEVWKTVLDAYAAAKRMGGNRTALRFASRLKRAFAHGPRFTRQGVTLPAPDVILASRDEGM